VKAKILLADDDEEVLAALSAMLASEDYDVVVAKNGREAIEHFQEGRFDIALLDLNMPVKGGWEAFERLTGIHPLLQVIVITARPDQYPLAAAAGVAALMEKPLDLPLLLRTIDEIRLVQAGLLTACAGMAGLVLSHGLPGVVASACLAGLGLACVYPITISLLSREFGSASSRIGSLMFTLSNIGGGLLPWMVGVSSNHFGTLKTGLAVPLLGSALMYALYLREWRAATVAAAD